MNMVMRIASIEKKINNKKNKLFRFSAATATPHDVLSHAWWSIRCIFQCMNLYNHIFKIVHDTDSMHIWCSLIVFISCEHEMYSKLDSFWMAEHSNATESDSETTKVREMQQVFTVSTWVSKKSYSLGCISSATTNEVNIWHWIFLT